MKTVKFIGFAFIFCALLISCETTVDDRPTVSEDELPEDKSDLNAYAKRHIEAQLQIPATEKYTLTIEPSPAYPYLQLYTPDHRGSIAIENLSGAPNCFNNKMGLHILQPQEVWKLETSYQLTSK